MEDVPSQAVRDFPLNFLQGFMKTEDSVEKFHPRSPCSFCDPGSHSAIRMEFSTETASFPFHLRVEKLVPFLLSKNSHRKFHVNGKRSSFLVLSFIIF